MYKNPYQTFHKFKIKDMKNIPAEIPLLLLAKCNERPNDTDIELVPVTYNGTFFSSNLNQGRVHESVIIAWGLLDKSCPFS